jgi:predicted Zn-ribbon and HTH transcriptional regulator
LIPESNEPFHHEAIMFRRDLIERLMAGPMTATRIAREARAPIAEVVEDLGHLEKSLKHQGRRLMVEPAVCRKCGFEFGRDKFARPSRCPECRGTWLTEPVVSVVESE